MTEIWVLCIHISNCHDNKVTPITLPSCKWNISVTLLDTRKNFDNSVAQATQQSLQTIQELYKTKPLSTNQTLNARAHLELASFKSVWGSLCLNLQCLAKPWRVMTEQNSATFICIQLVTDASIEWSSEAGSKFTRILFLQYTKE